MQEYAGSGAFWGGSGSTFAVFRVGLGAPWLPNAFLAFPGRSLLLLASPYFSLLSIACSCLPVAEASEASSAGLALPSFLLFSLCFPLLFLVFSCFLTFSCFVSLRVLWHCLLGGFPGISCLSIAFLCFRLSSPHLLLFYLYRNLHNISRFPFTC